VGQERRLWAASREATEPWPARPRGASGAPGGRVRLVSHRARAGRRRRTAPVRD